MKVFPTLFLSLLGISITILVAIHSVLVALPFILLSFVFGFLAASQYLFNKRTASYIGEGHRLLISYSDSTLSTADYVTLVRSWRKKVSKDIRHHERQIEDFVLLEATIQEFESALAGSSTEDARRNHALQIVGTQIRELKGLQERP